MRKLIAGLTVVVALGLIGVASAQDTTSLLSAFLTNLRNGTLYVDISNADVILARDAANVIAERNSTNGQTFRIYNTYTDSSNYERAGIGWTSNTFGVLVGAGGSGSSRSISVGTDATSSGSLNIQTSGTNRWQVVGSTGHLVAVADNTYDLGASGATRPRTVYVGTSVIVGTNTTLGAVTAAASGTRFLCISTTGVIASSASACSGT